MSLWHLKKVHIPRWLTHTWPSVGASQSPSLHVLYGGAGGCDCHLPPEHCFSTHPAGGCTISHLGAETHTQLRIQNSAPAAYIFYLVYFVRWKVRSLLQEKNSCISVSSLCWSLCYIYQNDFSSSFSEFLLIFWCCGKNTVWKRRGLGSQHLSCPASESHITLGISLCFSSLS